MGPQDEEVDARAIASERLGRVVRRRVGVDVASAAICRAFATRSSTSG